MELIYRSLLRGQLTKIVNSTNEYLGALSTSTADQEQILEDLNSFHTRLQNAHSLLKEADEAARLFIEEKNLVSECNTIIEYDDKAVTAIARVQHRINTTQRSTQSSNNEQGNGNPNTSNTAAHVHDHTMSYIKLPRLELKRFNGDYEKWVPFWEQFKTAVHLNTALDDASQFNFLQNALSGKAADTIAGLTPSEGCYNEAVEMLEEEYGSSDRIIDKHMEQLMSTKSVKSASEVVGLRRLYSSLTSATRSLNALSVSPSHYNVMLKSIILRALPSELRVQYHRSESHSDNKNVVEHNLNTTAANNVTQLETSRGSLECDSTIKGILNFLKVEVDSLEKANAIPCVSVISSERKANQERHHTATRLFTVSQNSKGCFFCDSPVHSTVNCDANMTVTQRKEKLKTEFTCFKCTQPKHTSKYCKNKYIRCKRCSKRHATCMCDPNYCNKRTNIENNETTTITNSVSERNQNNAVSLISESNNESVFLQTGRAYGLSETCKDVKFLVRFMLDSASTRTYIREDVVKMLKWPVVGVVTLNIIPFGSSEIPPDIIYNCVALKLKSQYSDNDFTLKAVVVPEICIDVLPVPNQNYAELQSFQLADSCVSDEHPVPGVSLLIGGDYYQNILMGETKMITERLAAVNTKFGWTLHGPAPRYMSKTNCDAETIFLVNSIELSEDDVDKFWNLEVIGINNENLTNENAFLEEFLRNSIKYNGKRYEVELPWKNDNIKFDSNYKGAKMRLKSLLQRLTANESKLYEYDCAVWDLISSGVAEPAPEMFTSDKSYYLPHRAVYREDKATTRLRIVYDASVHSPDKNSLNDCLHQGPNMLPDLLATLLDFRIGKIGILADVEKAFLQISVNKSDRSAQRFLWFEEKLRPRMTLPPIRAYQLTRVTFGVNCSPFLLNAVIKKHLQDYGSQFQFAAAILGKHLYVDDLVTSVDDVIKAEKLFRDAKAILKLASMNLRKWNSNNDYMRQLFHKEGDHDNTSPMQKVLGILWCTLTDVIKVDLMPTITFIGNIKQGTKRSILKAISRIFDPLGFLAPFVITAKLLMQNIWRLKPNPHGNDDFTETGNIQLHLFCDASPKAYGAVAYVRHEIETGHVTVNFLCAKNRIAPLTRSKDDLSLPKLALIGCRLKTFIFKNTSFSFHSIYMWTDSRIALCWIKGGSSKFKQFVSNRVRGIESLSTNCLWRHCPGGENPADMLTRGIAAKTLVQSTTWKFGPSWLNQPPSQWPSEANHNNDIPLVNLTDGEDAEHSMDTYRNPIFRIEDISSYHRLLRITAYLIRFINNISKKNLKRSTSLTAEELEDAEKYWISVEQNRYFPNEILLLTKREAINRHSEFLKLSPFLYSNGHLRLTGRLHEINDKANIAHPIILPKMSHLSLLLTRYAHESSNHGGVNVTLTKLRQRFWITKGRQLVKKAINKCLICKRLWGKPASEPFAPLPKDRITSSRAFEIIGVDFAGPLIVTSGEIFSAKKVYLMLFTCAAVRAVHIELVCNLTTECCLNAVRRFISRRGMPRIIYSDNAKSFKRADYEIQQLYKRVNGAELSSFAATNGIRWKFIVERAPWWGGWWERLIRTIKNSLKATIGKAILTYEQLETIMVEVEASVNSRPLTYVSSDPADFKPLQPSDFLLQTGATHLININENPSLQHNKLNELWQNRHRLLLNFWKRWRSEYVCQLRSAHEVNTTLSSSIQIDDVVLVHEPSTPRLLWKLGRVTQVYPGRDGKTRACELKLGNGKTIRRSIQSLYPLEVK